MPAERQVQTYQSLDTRLITLAPGESAVVQFASQTRAAVPWGEGGVSWSISAVDRTEDEDMECEVSHTLMPAADDVDTWIPSQLSPFTKPAGGVEFARIERLRFENTADSVNIYAVVGSASRMTVETFAA